MSSLQNKNEDVSGWVMFTLDVASGNASHIRKVIDSLVYFILCEEKTTVDQINNLCCIWASASFDYEGMSWNWKKIGVREALYFQKSLLTDLKIVMERVKAMTDNFEKYAKESGN